MEIVIKEGGLIAETENYTVVLDKVFHQLTNTEYEYIPGYAVVNKTTGVREAESVGLAQAHLVARRLQEGLDLELSGEAARNELAAKSNLIPNQRRN